MNEPPTDYAMALDSLRDALARIAEFERERDAAVKLAAENEAAFDGKAEEFDQLAERLAERTAERDAAVRERDAACAVMRAQAKIMDELRAERDAAARDRDAAYHALSKISWFADKSRAGQTIDDVVDAAIGG